jgi:hypothetical protein
MESTHSASITQTIRDHIGRTVIDEAARIEIALRDKDHGIAALMADPTARLGYILEAQRERLELGAYLKGLRFLEEAMTR